ncbi:MAG: two-component sensor histidine kinase, partial [Paenibacillus sp.]|nr:two-component sensor histidine kinase [Paenibacillus sp.]
MIRLLGKLIRITNNLRLKHKLLISYIVVVMIPVLIVGASVTAYFRNQAMERAIAQTTNNVEKVKTRTATMLRVPTDISDFFMLDGGLEKMVNTRYPNVLELTKAYLEYDDFRNYDRTYREV